MKILLVLNSLLGLLLVLPSFTRLTDTFLPVILVIYTNIYALIFSLVQLPFIIII